MKGPENQMPNLQRWAYWFILIGILATIILAGSAAEQHRKERNQIHKDQEKIESFSRMSEADEIQDAYNRQYPLK